MQGFACRLSLDEKGIGQLLMLATGGGISTFDVAIKEFRPHEAEVTVRKVTGLETLRSLALVSSGSGFRSEFVGANWRDSLQLESLPKMKDAIAILEANPTRRTASQSTGPALFQERQRHSRH
jgi:hypothetical protein